MCYLLHAGTALSGGDLVTAGGRVLNAVGSGADLASARAAAYAVAECAGVPRWLVPHVTSPSGASFADGCTFAAAGQHPRAVLRSGLRLHDHPAHRDSRRDLTLAGRRSAVRLRGAVVDVRGLRLADQHPHASLSPEQLLLLLGIAGFLVIGLPSRTGSARTADSGAAPRARLPRRRVRPHDLSTCSTATSCASRPSTSPRRCW